MDNLNPKICIVASSEMSINAFLLSHLQALSNIYNVTVITNTNNPEFLAHQGVQVEVIALNIKRHISVIFDVYTFFRLSALIKKNNYAAVHSVTPKAGLLAMVAAWVNKVPLRIHTFTGQVWVNKYGLKRWVLKSVDCLIGSLTTNNIVDSPSQRDFLISEKVLKPEKSIVFGKGSISGVNLKRFRPNQSKRRLLRRSLNISEDSVLCLFLGRLKVDKGVLDLAKAFINTTSKIDGRKTVLIYVGPDEQDMRIKIQELEGFDGSKLLFFGHAKNPEDFLAAADFLCLPSYREGFGSVIIEAAAVGIPSLASRIYGVTDAIEDNKTGLLHKAGNVAEMQEKLNMLICDDKLRVKLGDLALSRARAQFDSNIITGAWVKFYQEQI